MSAQVMPDEIKESEKKYNEWGIIAGVNLQQLTAYPFEQKYNPGITLGSYIKRRKNSVGIMTGLTASFAQATTSNPAAMSFIPNTHKESDSVTKAVFNTINLNVPFIVEIRPAKSICFQMGVAYSYLVYTHEQSGVFARVWNTDKVFSPGNFSTIAGVEFELSQKVRIAVNYSIGFLDINNKKFPGITDRWMTSSGHLNLIYRLKKQYFKHY